MTKVFACVKRDTLYLNGYQHKLHKWYAMGLTQGTFIVFESTIPHFKKNDPLMAYGAIGGGVATIKRAVERNLYVLSLRTGNVKPLNFIYMEERLKENKELSAQYHLESNPESDSTLLK